MPAIAKMLPITLKPDSARTVLRPFALEDPSAYARKDCPRVRRIAERVMAFDQPALDAKLELMMDTLGMRHRDVHAHLLRRFDELEGLTFTRAQIGDARALVIAAYLSEEFSFESVALFNPSVVAHPDQTGIAAGDTRILLSLRGIGEGHVSSLIFRTGTWAADGMLTIDEPSAYAVPPIAGDVVETDGVRTVALDCGGSCDVSESVIFPFLPSQGKGIEDMRLCAFTEDDGTRDFRGTFTAFNGADVRQTLVRTPDFKHFDMHTVTGPLAEAKGAALFPRRIDGRYFMIGRQDSENLWLFSSDNVHHWENGTKLLGPRFPWEAIQIGNCGSPIEIDEGWLMLTHGVGMVRNYCVGACLLDKKDPSKVLARLSEPLLEPSDTERDGYVPNVVYSCGALLRGRDLLLPYGVADSYTAFATVQIDKLLAAMS